MLCCCCCSKLHSARGTEGALLEAPWGWTRKQRRFCKKVQRCKTEAQFLAGRLQRNSGILGWFRDISQKMVKVRNGEGSSWHCLGFASCSVQIFGWLSPWLPREKISSTGEEGRSAQGPPKSQDTGTVTQLLLLLENPLLLQPLLGLCQSCQRQKSSKQQLAAAALGHG